jgi:hypothetical protein
VRNAGTAPAGPFRVLVAGDATPGVIDFQCVQPNGVLRHEVGCKGVVAVTVDPNDDIDESDEGDNTQKGTCTEPPAPEPVPPPTDSTPRTSP